ncbi:MAG: DinB family protein [Microbacteriaceae bacterium]
MPITPDTKDWTWVLERPCPECGFDARTIAGSDVAALLRREAALWPAVLDRESVTERPDDHTWSELEYAAHVRDVMRLAVYRTQLMLGEDDPEFANWDQDQTAIAERYNEHQPDVVATDLVEVTLAFAALLDTVRDDQWQRSGRRGDGARFTVDSFARYNLHDVVHHGWDVRAG